MDFHSVFTIKGIYILSITYIALSDTAARVDPSAFYSAPRAARYRARGSAAVISAKNAAPFLCIFYPYAVDKTPIIGYNKLCEQACGKAGRALRNAVRFRDSPRCREEVARRHIYSVEITFLPRASRGKKLLYISKCANCRQADNECAQLRCFGGKPPYGVFRRTELLSLRETVGRQAACVIFQVGRPVVRRSSGHSRTYFIGGIKNR